MSSPRTLFQKIWDKHLVRPSTAETPAVLYIDLHLVHEVTSPQAFAELSSTPISGPMQGMHHETSMGGARVDDEGGVYGIALVVLTPEVSMMEDRIAMGIIPSHAPNLAARDGLSPLARAPLHEERARAAALRLGKHKLLQQSSIVADDDPCWLDEIEDALQ